MKRIKKLTYAMLIAFLLMASSISPAFHTTAIVKAATIAISSKASTLEVGTSKTLKIIGTSRKVTWYSNKKSVATVSSTGKVTAKAVGTATITASVAGKKLTSSITVKTPIKLSYTSYSMDKGTTKKLYITGTTSKVTWSSSNKSIATVSSWGTITAVSTGKATITAQVAGKKLTCTVTVKEPIKLTYSTYTLVKGTTKKLYISGTKSKVTWSSSNKSVATVSSYGTITALAAGKASITAQVDGKKLTCIVTVKEPIKISNTSLTLEEGTTKKLTITGTTSTITWTSSDTSIATVSSLGTITAKAEGQTTITAQVDGKKLTCTVTVTPPPNPYVVNAPFNAKEIKSANISMVVPKDWSPSIATPSDRVTLISLTPDNLSSGSSINFSILNMGIQTPDYDTAKLGFSESLNETNLKLKYDTLYGNLGITDYSFTDFEQTDFHSNFGDAYKVEYVVSVMTTQTKKLIYKFYIGQYFVEITTLDTDNSDLETITDYMLNSIVVK